MTDTASDEFTRADPLYIRAQTHGARNGDPFDMSGFHEKRDWILPVLGLLAVIVGLGLLGMGR